MSANQFSTFLILLVSSGWNWWWEELNTTNWLADADPQIRIDIDGVDDRLTLYDTILFCSSFYYNIQLIDTGQTGSDNSYEVYLVFRSEEVMSLRRLNRTGILHVISIYTFSRYHDYC